MVSGFDACAGGGVKGHSRDDRPSPFNTFNGKKKTKKYIHEKKQCSLFDCLNAIAFAVGNVNVLECPLTLPSDGFVDSPLFFHQFTDYVQIPTYSLPCL